MEKPPGPPLLVVVVVGALALFGAVMLLQWVIASVLGIVKLAIAVVVVVALGALVLSALGRR